MRFDSDVTGLLPMCIGDAMKSLNLEKMSTVNTRPYERNLYLFLEILVFQALHEVDRYLHGGGQDWLHYGRVQELGAIAERQ